MTKRYLCFCEAINTVIYWSRYVGILPLNPMKIKYNHLNIGCTFYISNLWLCFSGVLQIFLAVYIITTTAVRLYSEVPQNSNPYEWYLTTIGYMIMGTDNLVSLCFATFKAKRIRKLLERISRINGCFEEMRTISHKIKCVIICLLSCYLVSTTSFLYVAWLRLAEFNSFTWENILDSPPGVMIRGLVNIVSQIQCALVVTFCLLISSKFQYLSATIKSTLDHANFFPSREQTRTTRKMKASTIKWVTSASDTSNIVNLEHISNQHQEVMFCLSEVNNCFGFQLLFTFTALLYFMVYYLYRALTLNSNDNYMTKIQQKFHCMMSLTFHLTKLILYIIMGQKINNQCKEPIREMQRGKLLGLPAHTQQQIQSLIMQWSSDESHYLSAYNVINIGPWLLAPIVSNTITYLLVALQFRNSSEKSEVYMAL